MTPVGDDKARQARNFGIYALAIGTAILLLQLAGFQPHRLADMSPDSVYAVGAIFAALGTISLLVSVSGLSTRVAENLTKIALWSVIVVMVVGFVAALIAVFVFGY